MKDVIYAAHQLLWTGWAWLAACLVELVVYYFIWKVLLGPLIFKVVSGIPSVSSNKGTVVLISLAVGAYLLLLLWSWTASFIYLRIDRVFYSLKSSPALAKFGAMAGTTTQILIYGLGFAVIWRVVSWALADRLIGHMGFAHGGGAIHDPNVWLAGILAIIFIPLSIRLWYLPVITALETDPVIGSWKLLLRATKGHTRSLFLATLPQWALLGICYLVYQHVASGLLGPVISTAAHAGDYDDLASLSKAMEGNISIDLFGALLAFVLVIGPIISLIAAMQLSVIRGLIGAPLGGETLEQDYAVADYDTQQQELPLPEDLAQPLPAYTGVVAEEEIVESSPGGGYPQGEFSEEVRAAAEEEAAGLYRAAGETIEPPSAPEPEFPPLHDAKPEVSAPLGDPVGDPIPSGNPVKIGEDPIYPVEETLAPDVEKTGPVVPPLPPPSFGPVDMPPPEDASPVIETAEPLPPPAPEPVQHTAPPPVSAPISTDAPPEEAGASRPAEEAEETGKQDYDPLIDDIPDTPLPARLKRSDD